MNKAVSELKPNDVIKVGDNWFRCRYFYYHNNNVSIDLQRELDQVSPYYDSTCIRISINKDVDIKFEVKDAENE
ncbi:hypothetical protein EX227_23240 [Providencia rettgeri]|uniref:Uncharacterized protein n=1 Tax=Providencia rettgeri TaxID=587 RepID=A0AAP2NYB3_PRORE|nr:hypothetical protein [Providencia rettgeri]MBX6952906.1 hypothetical protein [Providencia rettgeri]MBX6957684.1 hypothetical protein [Providencia rettgeri]MBX6962538.1 hypothetical protein [Providencia rettgeri]MBX6972826.1 hypothetical protein [Providencia rettgeri]MBX6983179.1 hypothetical protein [Providencia rettgeri]